MKIGVIFLVRNLKNALTKITEYKRKKGNCKKILIRDCTSVRTV